MACVYARLLGDQRRQAGGAVVNAGHGLVGVQHCCAPISLGPASPGCPSMDSHGIGSNRAAVGHCW